MLQRFLATILLSLLLGGCVATGPLYQSPPAPPAGYATLVVSRAEGITGGAWDHHYYIDDVLVATLKTGGYTHLAVKEGPHRIHWSTRDGTVNMLPMSIDLRSGETAYYFDNMEPGGSAGYGTISIRSSVRMLRPSHAESVLATYRYSEPVKTQID